MPNVKNIKTESKFERPPALQSGAYPARTVQMIYLGLQKQEPYMGQEKPPKPEIYITYECADEFLLDENGDDIEDKPRWISETITLNSLDSDLATSTARYYALDPNVEKGGEFLELVDTPCLLTLVKKKSKKTENEYNKISGVSSMRDKDAQKAPALVNKPKVFDFDNPDLDVFLSLPNWLQDKIKDSLDYPGSDLEGLVEGSGGKVEKKEKEVEQKQETSNDDEDW